MKFFLIIYLIVVVLSSFLIVGIAFSVGGIIYGCIALFLCLYLVYVVNKKLNKQTNVNDAETSLIKMSLESKNKIKKIEILDNKGFFGIKKQSVFLIGLLITGGLIFILYKSYTFYGIVSLLLFLFSLSLSLIVKNSAIGKIGFIDIENNDIYIIASGMFTFKYKKYSLSNLANLRGRKTVVLGRSDQTRYDVFIDVDGKKTFLCENVYKDKYNEVLNNFVKTYKLKSSLERKVDGLASALNKLT